MPPTINIALWLILGPAFVAALALLGWRSSEVGELRKRVAEMPDHRAYAVYPFTRLLPAADACWRDADTLVRTDARCVARFDRDGDGDVDAADLEEIRGHAVARWEGWRKRITEADPATAQRMIEAVDEVVTAMMSEGDPP